MSKEDYEYGIQQEQLLQPILEKYFGKLNTFENQFNKYDFENSKYLIEVKSRFNNYNKYDTTMIGTDKIIETNKKIVFVFNFLDKKMFIIFNEEKFKKYQIKSHKRNGTNRLDKQYVCKEHYYIPITDLFEIY